MKIYRLRNWVRAVLIISGLALLIVLVVPMWKIELNAPQYPEGLALQIYPHKIGGNVDIINGLNHYIGMKTLHTEDFIEFKILPYIIGFFALACFAVAFINRKKWLTALTILFIIFGIVAMYDFWRWEYDYGHDLNPEAAIQVPGMAYQPPLIGYKQLLNFAAYSIPDIGGFIFIGVGFILLLATIIELKSKKKHRASDIRKDDVAIIASFLLIFSASCNRAPQPIKIGADTCSFCKMTISDNRFGGEIITKKGKAYKFDDIHCLVSFNKSGAVKAGDVDHTYLVKFNVPHNFIEASKATFFKSNEFRTPMGGNVAAFESEQDLRNTNEKFKGTVVSWNDLVK